MIDDNTRAALETHLAVALKTAPAQLFRALARPHGGDEAARSLAARLTAGLAFPFDIHASGARAEAPRTPGPTDGRKSWSEPAPDKSR